MKAQVSVFLSAKELLRDMAAQSWFNPIQQADVNL
jgi:hypothetical protein